MLTNAINKNEIYKKKERVNKKNDYKKKNKTFNKNKRRPFKPMKGYPNNVCFAFKNDKEKCDLFIKIIREYAQGRHILEISPLDIYELNNGMNAKKRAFCNILSLDNAEKLNIFGLHQRELDALSLWTFKMLQQGILNIIKNLDLNIYVSPDKITNAGNAIKNYDGMKTYGGISIRAYLTHNIEKEEISEAAEDLFNKTKIFINEFSKSLNNYKMIKSIPFSIFRYKQFIRTSENGEILIPDIEAKYNIKRIIGVDNYNKYSIQKITMKDATFLESILIEKIKELAQEEANNLLNNIINSFQDSTLKEDIKKSYVINNIITLTNHGLINDIISYMDNNAKLVLNLEKDNMRPLIPDEVKALFQIEYASVHAETGDITDGMIWIADFGEAIKSQRTNFAMIKELINLHFIPKIKGKDITRYNIDTEEFLAIVEDAKNKENPQNFIEENLQYLISEN